MSFRNYISEIFDWTELFTETSPQFELEPDQYMPRSKVQAPTNNSAPNSALIC